MSINKGKSIVGIFLMSLLVLIAIQRHKKKKTSQKNSDVDLIFTYITRPKGYTINPADSCFYLIDTDFRTFKTTSERSATETRAVFIKNVLSKKLSPALVGELGLHCFTTPNSSKEIQNLKAHAERAWGHKANLFLLTFSNPCVAKSGYTYYYVEKLYNLDKKGSADLFVIYNGIIQSVIPVWIN